MRNRAEFVRVVTAATFGVWALGLPGCDAQQKSDDNAQPWGDEEAPLASCNYRNPFSSEPECKEYTGEDWTIEDAQLDCETGLAGGAGVYADGERCELNPRLGTCTVEVDIGKEYRLFVGGDDSSKCDGAELACTGFVSGTFVPAGVCTSGETEDGHTVFIWPYKTCEEPIAGEEAGQGADGTVCVWNSIAGCVEEGRDFRDYGSCDVVQTNRPYYPVSPYANAEDDDPRLEDAEYLKELAWVAEQTTSCGCVCCHSSAAPEGPAIWRVDGEALWPDQMSDTAIGMFAGYIDSSALGAFDPEDNNGFDRLQSAMSSTDPERMVAFWQGEMDRRGLTGDDMSDEPPLGQNLLDQIRYELPDCGEGEGIDSRGLINWTSDFNLRYLYILEEDSANPGVPPNFDIPEGVLWRVDITHDGQPLASGVPYGSLPPTAIQVVPDAGVNPPELVTGKRYHLYGLYDVALPATRCVFVMPKLKKSGNGGCNMLVAEQGAVGGLAILAMLGIRRRRRSPSAA